MATPSKLLLKLSRHLFNEPSTQSAFVDALINPHPFPACILWCDARPDFIPFQTVPPLDWQPVYVDRLALEELPGRHLWHTEGKYYCLDFSSVFAASVLLAIPAEMRQQIQTVVDVCASPGGKSLFSWVALRPPLLLSNEVIGKRLGALVSNLRRCGAVGAIALNVDSSLLAERIPHSAEVVLVDAPCSGQSLLAKGDAAPGCFHPVTINKNANRQKRILANAAQVVAPGGYLAYMTCAFSPEENEQVCDWLLQRFPQFQPVAVPHLASFQSHLTSHPCYRMFPHDGLGAGAFTALFRHTAAGDRRAIAPEFLQHPKVISIRSMQAPSSPALSSECQKNSDAIETA